VSGRTRAVLLAGGLGTRLRPLTETIPKCLVPVAGRPLLDYWIEALADAGVRDVLVNTHHLRGQVRAYIDDVNRKRTLQIVETYEPALLGSAGTIHANRGWMDGADDCLIVYADNFSSVDLADLLAYHRCHGDPMTMLLFRAPDPRAAGIAELDAEGRVVSFVEKPRQPAGDLANAGVYVVTAEAYRQIADMNAFDFGFDVLPRFVGRMRGRIVQGYHRDIGTMEALTDAARVAYDRTARHEPGRPAVFLDRDGTVIEHVHYLCNPEEVRLIPGVAEAIRRLQSRGYACVIVTNQSVVGRGMLTEEGLEGIHQVMHRQLAEHGVALDGLYFCPTAPVQADPLTIEHPDRKPAAGMLLRAAGELQLDLSRSWMIGDSLSDVLAGQNAGCRGSILVRTGRGAEVDATHPAIDHVAKDLSGAADLIVDQAPQAVTQGSVA
jgi:D,D-heptose 1,7-bisphosphate phosphatase